MPTLFFSIIIKDPDQDPESIYEGVVALGVEKARKSWGKIFTMGIVSGSHLGFGAYLAISIGGTCFGLAKDNPGLQKVCFFFFFCEPIYKHPNSNEPFGVPISHRFCWLKKKVLASSSIKSIRKKRKWSSLLTLRASGILGSEKSSNAELGAPYLLTKWTFGMKASEKENGLETKKWNVRKKFRAKLTLQAQKITNLHIPKRVHWCISTVPSQFNSLATSHICSDIFLSTEIHRIFSRSYSLPLQSRENKIFNLYM